MRSKGAVGFAEGTAAGVRVLADEAPCFGFDPGSSSETTIFGTNVLAGARPRINV